MAFGLLCLCQFPFNHGSLDSWHQQQTGWRQEAPGGKESYLLGVPSLKASFSTVCTCKVPSAVPCDPSPAGWSPCPRFQSVFPSHPNLTTFPSVSVFHFRNKRNPNCNASLSCCTQLTADGQSMWYHVRPGALMPCLGSDFLQFTRVLTTQISDNIKVYLLP